MFSADFTSQLLAFFQVLSIDLILAGDNAVAVGLVAGGLPPDKRKMAILIGLAVAVVTRIAFSLVAVQLLAIPGLLLVGGLLLAWVCWKMWCELHDGGDDQHLDTVVGDAKAKSLGSAIFQIVIADVSMSLDNVLAVAGAARHHPWIMVFGLGLAIILMGAAATAIARLLERHKWIGYVGLAIVVFVCVRMIYDGGHELWPHAKPYIDQFIGHSA